LLEQEVGGSASLDGSVRSIGCRALSRRAPGWERTANKPAAKASRIRIRMKRTRVASAPRAGARRAAAPAVLLVLVLGLALLALRRR